MRQTFVAFSLAVGLAATVGCGSSTGPSDDLEEGRLRVDAAAAVADVATCPLVTTPGQASASVDALIAQARRWPEYQYDGATLRQVLSDLVTDAEECDPRLARRIERAVDTL